MALEHEVNLATGVAAEREFAGEQPASTAAAELAQRRRTEAAVSRLRLVAIADPVVRDLLTAMGLSE
jgi:hypothetical protein